MSDPASSRRRRESRSGFSLASLLLLVAVVAVYAAGLSVALAKENRLSPEALLPIGCAGWVIGAVVGLGVGVHRLRPIVGGLAGSIVGGLVGPPTAILMTTPKSLPVVLVGAVLIVAFAGLARLLSGPQPRPGGNENGIPEQEDRESAN